MKHFFLLSMAVLTMSFNAQSQLYKDEETFLWKISGNGLKQDSYFFITMSNTCEEKVALSPKILNVLNNVQQVVFETGLTNRNNENKVQQLIFLNTETQSAKNMLSANTYKNLQQKAEDMGIKELVLNGLNMFFISNRLFAQCINCSLQQVDRAEDEIRLYAKKNKIKTDELFSIEETIPLFFDSLPKEYWESYISYLLTYPDIETKNINNKAALYKQEKFKELKAIYTNNDKTKSRYSFPNIESNRINMLFSRIENKIKDSSAFITLDIADVANEPTSLFNQLVKAGYTLTPVLN
jgi:uncharacterized protein YbaP (TraB family)